MELQDRAASGQASKVSWAVLGQTSKVGCEVAGQGSVKSGIES